LLTLYFGITMENNLDHVFKVLLIGDAGVGKSSILLQFTDGYFNDNLQSTIGTRLSAAILLSMIAILTAQLFRCSFRC